MEIPFVEGGHWIEHEVRDAGIIKVPHELGQPAKGFLCFTHTGLALADDANPKKDKEIWLKQPMSFYEVETKTGSSPIVFENLNGDRDWEYMLTGYWATTNLNRTLQLEPNNVTANFESTQITVITTVTDVQTTTPRVGYNTGANQWSYSKIHFIAKSGQDRYMLWNQAGQNATPDTVGRLGWTWWNDGSTNVTSLEVVATDLVSTSEFTLYKRGLGGETLRLWVF